MSNFFWGGGGFLWCNSLVLSSVFLFLAPVQECIPEAPVPLREGKGGRVVPGGDPGGGFGSRGEEAGSSGQLQRDAANRKGQTEGPERGHVP